MLGPADIVRACLLSQNLVVLPLVDPRLPPLKQIPGDGSTVCFVRSMPNDYDQAVCVYDTAGIYWGRSQPTGQSWVHPGFRVLIRSLDLNGEGYGLANAIARGLDMIPVRSDVTTPDGAVHRVQSIYRISPVIGLGEEVGEKRQLWSITGRVAMRDSEQPPMG